MHQTQCTSVNTVLERSKPNTSTLKLATQTNTRTQTQTQTQAGKNFGREASGPHTYTHTRTHTQHWPFVLSLGCSTGKSFTLVWGLLFC
jgi:hypothetical protein